MNQNQRWTLFASILFLISSSLLYCKKTEEPKTNLQHTVSTDTLTALYETTPVEARRNDDAADDPAIWINLSEPENSLIIGTNKKAGLNLYTLSGEQVFFIDEGLVNNVDLRYGFDLNGRKVDFTGASNRSNNSICLHILDGENRELIPVHARTIESGVDEVYGFCLYHSHQTGDYFAFINGKNGQIEQWKLMATAENKIDATLVRNLQVDSQPEGMVADDELGYLYVGEEGRGIWKFEAEPDADTAREFVANSGEENEAIAYDIEGLAILHQPNGKGYLIASSQGNNSYAIFRRDGRNEYLTSVQVKDGVVDGSEETDGLEVTNFSFNDDFPGGLLIVQDGFNFDGDSLASQNFKLIDWRKVAWFIDPDMVIDAGYFAYGN